MKTLRASFFSLLVNLNKIKYFTFSYCYTDLGVGCSTKEANGIFFRERQNHENTVCVNFPKISQARCFMLCVCSTGLCNRCSTKEAIGSFFCRTIQIIKDVFNFSFMLLNYANRDVLYRLSTIQDDVQGALRKKQLIASFVKHFTENDGNTICIVFQFHNPNLRQGGCFKPYANTRLGRGRSTKEQNAS